ncbi:uncharacterized protein LY79DRAFT_12032 [Colletotrichum navitas]|uniref:Uncharacterized protein n=1 Tax=Colletotrichum navitas TaxID=681940 RepID=A0AAD8VCM0_9PEZI|nr:uncharacterized protein LY79DRAFT_12032 [Colletotrichum navitas]KAK1600243.1 hypothetical protein LY79DRAFT_12032 [Colletotrichum navitas]
MTGQDIFWLMQPEQVLYSISRTLSHTDNTYRITESFNTIATYEDIDSIHSGKSVSHTVRLAPVTTLSRIDTSQANACEITTQQDSNGYVNLFGRTYSGGRAQQSLSAGAIPHRPSCVMPRMRTQVEHWQNETSDRGAFIVLTCPVIRHLLGKKTGKLKEHAFL